MDIYTSDSLHYVFSKVMRTHWHKMHQLLQDQEVYPGQPPLLFALKRKDGQSQKELAEQLHIQPATITVMLNRMVKTGLVERRQDDKDQRVSRVYLTEKGRLAQTEVKETFRAMDAQCFGNFSEEDKVLLRRLMLQVHENLTNDSSAHCPEKPSIPSSDS
ncbi:DNA-binding transcriptional regulator, MarR family [Paenibacillus sp. 1_12]|uniref:MarR family winged helix-turn-helix transcriptional regulator n=1 Tax=Paenibacillus sp. 1_12 TaxID=1566278 RepID=UPI0008EDD4B5|nr:MarR family transcriptional regulator [Paenibacillus sp. 1_12]SFL84841.1 DNA-binding transcriptional regulator, MarR family [Paenibacillus sp. 1_12]